MGFLKETLFTPWILQAQVRAGVVGGVAALASAGDDNSHLASALLPDLWWIPRVTMVNSGE